MDERMPSLAELPEGAPCLSCSRHRTCGCPMEPRWCMRKQGEVWSGGYGCTEHRQRHGGIGVVDNG